MMLDVLEVWTHVYTGINMQEMGKEKFLKDATELTQKS